MNDFSSEFQPNIERTENSTDQYIKAADKTVTDRTKSRSIFSNLLQKTNAAAVSLSLILSSGVVNTDTAYAEGSMGGSTTISASENNKKEDSHEFSHIYASGLVDILVDKDGNPVNYTMPNGEVFYFDQSEIAKLKNEAVISRVPVIADIIPLPAFKTIGRRETHKYSEEQPRTEVLPDDVMSTEELTEKGLRIIQAPDTNLYIRKQAFGEGGPFADLTQKKENSDTAIVLVDGPIVAANFMQDARYAEFLSKVPQIKGDVSQFRADKIASARRGLESLQGAVEKPEGYEGLVLNTKIELKTFEEMTDEEIMRIMPSDRSASGAYVYNHDYDRDQAGNQTGHEIKEKSYIFVAVGRDVKSPENAVLYFTSDGKLQTMTKYISYKNSSPLPGHTHPNPDNLVKNPIVNDDRPYVFDDPNVGLRLEHEEVHRETLNTRPYDKANDEMLTDTEAGKRLSAAFQKWKDSGFTDNSGYNFIFSVPEEKGGGYIFVKDVKNNPDQPQSL